MGGGDLLLRKVFLEAEIIRLLLLLVVLLLMLLLLLLLVLVRNDSIEEVKSTSRLFLLGRLVKIERLERLFLLLHFLNSGLLVHVVASLIKVELVNIVVVIVVVLGNRLFW